MENLINFNVPSVVGNELKYIEDAINAGHLSGDGKYSKECHKWLEKTIGTKKALLTTSCTHALEMAALLLNIQADDEVIMPSYTFVSTANAFALRGAKIIFVDIRPDTMNIDETKIEAAITNKTRAIIPVHYAGVSCEMDTIMELAEKYGIFVVEDAAQGIMSTYKGKVLGSIGHLGTYSFHETKNFISGEGGALLINDERFIEHAEIIREKGTNRSKFIRGQVDKYTWQDIGSSYLPSELNAAFLFAQLENTQDVLIKRQCLWNIYYENLKNIKEIELPCIPEQITHNGHLFYLKLKNIEERSKFISYLSSCNVNSVFHYIPLHSSPAGKKYGEFKGDDIYTTCESEKLVRLPLFYSMTREQIYWIIDKIKMYFEK